MSSDMTPIRQFVEWSVTPVSYSLDGAAAATGLSRASLQRAINRGDLVARYYGTKPLLQRDELLAWIESLPSESPNRRYY